jgi:hypothetical protein
MVCLHGHVFVYHRVQTAIEIASNGLKCNRNKKLEFIDANEKERGIICLEDINKGDYVAEYKYDESFPVKDRASKDREYAGNHEGCYILEAQLPKGWICLDATRNINSWGRYFNHAPVSSANLKMHAPLNVNGKWRVAFMAIRDIKKGEELLYDYGQQPHPPDWMKRRSKVRMNNMGRSHVQYLLLLQVHPEKPTPLSAVERASGGVSLDGANSGQTAMPSATAEHIVTMDGVKDREPETLPMPSATAEHSDGVKDIKLATLPMPSQTAEDEEHVAMDGMKDEECTTLLAPALTAHGGGAAKFTLLHPQDPPEKTMNPEPAIHLPAEDSSTMKKCGLCSSKRKAEAFCKHCSEFMCQSCTTQHSVIKLFAKHKIILVEEGTKLKCNQPNCGLCSSEGRTKAFCEHCSEFICQSCTTQHSIIKLFAFISQNYLS